MWFTIYGFYFFSNYYVEINTQALAAQVTKERPWLTWFWCIQFHPSMLYSYTLTQPPLAPESSCALTLRRNMVLEAEFGGSRTPRANSPCHAVVASHRERCEGCVFTSLTGALGCHACCLFSLSPSAAWSLAHGSCECLLSTFCGPGTAELL